MLTAIGVGEGFIFESLVEYWSGPQLGDNDAIL
jgi:hypothetical protein